MVDNASGGSFLTMDGQRESNALWDTVFMQRALVAYKCRFAYYAQYMNCTLFSLEITSSGCITSMFMYSIIQESCLTVHLLVFSGSGICFGCW